MTNLEIEEDDAKSKFSGLEIEDEQDTKGKGDTSLEFEDESKTKKKTEIDLDIEESLKHKKAEEIEQDWDIHKEYEENVIDLSYEKKKRKKDITLSLDKQSFGDQTIDYHQLKKEFEEVELEFEKQFKMKTVGVRAEDTDLGEEIKSEKEKTEEQRDKVFEPDSKGIEYLIPIVSMYLDKKVRPEEIVTYIVNKLHDTYGGTASILSYKGKEHNDIVIGHTLFQESFNWNEFKKEREGIWKDTLLPTWSDGTFQSTENEFIYPFKEGNSYFGVAIVNFDKKIDELVSSRVEILLESSRGILLDEFHESGGRGTYAGKKKKKEENSGQEKKGFWAKLIPKFKKSS